MIVCPLMHVRCSKGGRSIGGDRLGRRVIYIVSTEEHVNNVGHMHDPKATKPNMHNTPKNEQPGTGTARLFTLGRVSTKVRRI